MKEQQLNLNGRKIEWHFMGLCIGLVLGYGTGVAIDNIVTLIGVVFMVGIAIAVYGSVKTSPKGFISDFSLGFLVGISAGLMKRRSSSPTELIPFLFLFVTPSAIDDG